MRQKKKKDTEGLMVTGKVPTYLYPLCMCGAHVVCTYMCAGTGAFVQKQKHGKVANPKLLPSAFETGSLTAPGTGYCPGSPCSPLVFALYRVTRQCDHTQHSLRVLVFMLAQQALFSAELSPHPPFSYLTLTSGKVGVRSEIMISFS